MRDAQDQHAQDVVLDARHDAPAPDPVPPQRRCTDTGGAPQRPPEAARIVHHAEALGPGAAGASSLFPFSSPCAAHPGERPRSGPLAAPARSGPARAGRWRPRRRSTSTAVTTARSVRVARAWARWCRRVRSSVNSSFWISSGFFLSPRWPPRCRPGRAGRSGHVCRCRSPGP